MTYNVFSGTLNPTQSISQKISRFMVHCVHRTRLHAKFKKFSKVKESQIFFEVFKKLVSEFSEIRKIRDL